jgi:EAL domain-containing protein (putative c-di-GMP-specific phosphodiesterase class I)
MVLPAPAYAPGGRLDMETNRPAASDPPAAAHRERLMAAAGLVPAAQDGATQPTAALLRNALEAIRRHFGMDLSFISEFRDGRRVFRYIDSKPGFDAVREGDSDALEQSYCQRLVDGRLPAVIPDTSLCAESAGLAATRTLPVGAHIGVPIRLSNGEVFGSMCCFSALPDPTLNERDVETMRLFSDFVAVSLEQHTRETASRTEIADRIRRVLQEEAFDTVYQPIMSVAQLRLVGYEALTRFRQPPAAPDEWFRDAALVGLGAQLEAACLRKALRGLEQIPRGAYLSLNASPAIILDGAMQDLLAQQPLGRLVLEVTEHASIADYEAIAAQLDPLRQAGLRLAVDDAGAGFASFRHILKMRPDDIKLDISLIRKIDSDLGARALAAALIRFAEETGSQIVAEGVETQAVLDVLRELKVNKVQGYLLGRPAPLPAGPPARRAGRTGLGTMPA